MKISKCFFVTVIAAVTVFIACQKHMDVTTTPTNPVTPTKPVTPVPPTENDVTITASIHGQVVDPNGNPVLNATVNCGTYSAQTDSNGIFCFSKIQISKYFGYVQVSKSGFFTGSRTIVTSTTGVNYLRIQLITRSSTGNFTSSSGGDITESAGNSVSVTSNAVVMAGSNTEYSGNVNVYTKWMDISDPNFNYFMPGDLRGTDTTNHTVGLQTYGIAAIELEGGGGEKLQITSGKTASISLAIPAKLQASAPATLAMWYFNDTTGKWIQQGFATKNGSNYIGTVSHFTYWSFDAPESIVYFSTNLKDQNSSPIAYTRMDITNTTVNDVRTGYSDSIGNVNGWIPKNTALSFDVYDNCGSDLASQSEGPFTSDQNLAAISVTTSINHMFTVHGTAIDCTNMPITNGVVSMNIDGLMYSTQIANGVFSISVLRCATALPSFINITIADSVSKMVLTKLIQPQSTNVDLGQISDCLIGFDQYFLYNINGTTYTIPDPPAIFTDSNIVEGNNKPGTILGATMGTPGTGNYKSTYFNVILTTTGTVSMFKQALYIGSTYYSDEGGVTCNITKYDDVGGYIQGSFSGNMFIDSTGSPYPMTGIFKVKRY